MKKGAIRARQQTLIRLLAKQFGDLPAETIAIIKVTKNNGLLDAWLDNLLTAAKLSDVGIR